jgi:hypothetical protein
MALAAGGCTSTPSDRTHVAGADLGALNQSDSGDPDPVSDVASADTLAGDPLAACPSPTPLDYFCTPADQSTCPSGLCLEVVNQCIAPAQDPNRWADCANGRCERCESAATCPVDCGRPPTFSGMKELHNATTLTFKVSGWRKVSHDDLATHVYGAYEGTGEVGDAMRKFVPDLPDGMLVPTAPNQLIGIDYVGAIPADYLSEQDRAEIEAYSYETDAALRRYALIVAKGIRHRMVETGATHVNLFCHSMGCHIIRYVIENDVEGLASANNIVRWATISGVIAGARLARLYDNAAVRQAGDLLGFNAVDFVHMNPDYVTDHSAVWDHKLREANNPLFTGMLIHHLLGTNPLIYNATASFPLLDLYNPSFEPNDGIMFSEDEYFQGQTESVRPRTLSGAALLPTRTSLHLDHELIRKAESAGLMVAAALTGSRRVLVSVSSLTLLDDHESDGPLDFSATGAPPAEVVAESEVRFDPYLADTFGENVVVHEQLLADRTLPIIHMVQGETVTPDYSIFTGPVLEAMNALTVRVRILEVDNYPRYHVNESLLTDSATLLDQTLVLPLIDGTVTVANDSLAATVALRVETF